MTDALPAAEELDRGRTRLVVALEDAQHLPERTIDIRAARRDALPLEDRRLTLLGGLRRRLRERRPAPRTEPRLVRQRRPTRRTRVQLRRRRLGLRQPVVVEDVLVHLLVRDSGVDVELRGVLHPASTMLDRLLAKSFPNPATDSGLPEVVRVHAVGVDVGLLGHPLQAPRSVLVGERAILTVREVLGLMEERRARLVVAGMDVQPVPQVAATPRDGLLPARTLHRAIFVDGDGARRTIEGDVLHAQGARRADAEAGVREHGDERFVPRVVRSLDERHNLVHVEQLARVDAPVGAGADLDVFGPLAVVVLEELPEGLPVVSEGAFGEFAVVLQAEEERVDIRLRHVGERDIGAFAGEAQPVDVVDDGADFDSVLGVLVVDEFEDGRAVVLGDVGVLEEGELVLEFVSVPLDVRDVDHGTTTSDPGYNAGDYGGSVGSPPGTTKVSYRNPPVAAATDAATGGVPA